MVMCPKQKQNANWNQVEIENLILKGRNLPRTNSTKSETQNIFAKKQENEHTPGLMKDSRPLVQYVYEMQVEDYLNDMRTSIFYRPLIDADLFKQLQAESSVRLVDDPLHNKYINYYEHYEDDDTTPVYFPSRLYEFRWMRHEVVLENHLTEEIPPCAMGIFRPDEAVSDSLLSICSQISTHQPVTDLYMSGVTCNSLEAPMLIKPVTVILSWCKFPEGFMQILLPQLIECHCGETLQRLWLSWMDLGPFESLLDELLEDLVAHHEAGLAQRKRTARPGGWTDLCRRVHKMTHHEAGLAQRKLELRLEGDEVIQPTNLSWEFVWKWRNRCEKVDSIDCEIDDD